MQKQNGNTTRAKQSPGSEPFTLDIRPVFARGDSPCASIDQAVANLKPGQDFILMAPFEPLPLFTKLAAQGFDHESQELPDGSWSIRFVRAREAVPGTPISSCCS